MNAPIHSDGSNSAASRETPRGEPLCLQSDLREVLDATDIGVWEYDHATDRVFWSPALRALLGRTEPVPSNLAAWLDLIHPDDLPRAQACIAATHATDRPLAEAECRLRAADGRWVWVYVRGRITRWDATGRPLLTAGTLLDISLRKHAELLVRTQHELAGILAEEPDRKRLLEAILGSALSLPELDGGGLYWREPDGGYRLVVRRGFSEAFFAQVSDLAADSPQAEVIRQGRMRCSCTLPQGHCTDAGLVKEIALVEEGLHSLVVLPIHVGGEPLASLNLASKRVGAIGPLTVTALETLARQCTQALERLLAQEEAASQRQNLAGLFGAINDYLFVLDLESHILHYNPAVAEGLGYGEGLLGQPIWVAHPPEVRDEARRMIAEVLAGTRANYLLPLLKVDGGHVLVDTRVVMGQWNGQPAMIGVSRDITVLQAMQEALQEREELYRTIVDQVGEAIDLVDPETLRFVEVGGAACRMLGYRHDEFLGLPLAAIQADASEEDMKRFCARLLASGGDSFEARHRCKDGRILDTQVTVRVIRLRDRNYFLGIWRDITEHKAAEAALRASNEFLKTLLDAIPVPIFYKDSAGRYLGCNRVFEDLLGQSRENIIGKTVFDIAPRELAEVYHARDLELLQRTGSQIYETQVKNASGAIHYVIVHKATFPNADGSGGGLIGAILDITANKAMEAALQTAKQLAEAASVAKSEFLAHMSHEIRTPLNGVLGLAQVLHQEPLTASQRTLVEHIQAAGQSLLVLFNDILDFSRIEAGQLRVDSRPFILNEPLTQIGNLLSQTAQAKKLELRIAPPTDPVGPLLGDSVRLEQVLVNLIGNAIKFTERGEVTLTVQVREATTTTVWLRFEVRDTGIGIPPETLQRLFTPFTQGDTGITRRFGGIGLGLAICQRLVDLMGGVIRAESRINHGSRFWFELPFLRAAEGGPVSEPDPARMLPTEPRLMGLRVLVVDDDAITRKVVERTLKREGATITLAADGQQAIQQIQAWPEAFDAVLMDVRMPVLDGLAATRLIRVELGLTELPIFAFTAGALANQQAAARAAGFNDVLAKPLDLEQLTTVLSPWVQPKPAPRVAPCPGLLSQKERESVADIPAIAPWHPPTDAAASVKSARSAERPAVEAPGTTLRPFDNAALQSKARALVAMLNTGQGKARKVSAEIEALLAGTDLQQSYAPIAHAIARLDFEAALEHLQTLARHHDWRL